MKLAIICNVGPLDRFGYQNTYAVALESFSLFADVVYLVSSTRNDTNVVKIKAQFPKIVYISNPKTWYQLDENGQEIFDIYQWSTNLEIGFRKALQAGADAVLWVTINEYIPERAANKIYARLEKMLAEKRPFDWTYRRFQLGRWLLEPDLCAPFLINLQIPEPYQFKFDWIETPEGERIDCLWNGPAWTEFSDEAIVDCPMEMTIDDLRDKMNFTKSYVQLNPDAPKVFNFETHVNQYYLHKFSRFKITDDSLDRFGKMIVRNHRSSFVSHYLVKKYRSPWKKIENSQMKAANSLPEKFSRLLSNLKTILSKLSN